MCEFRKVDLESGSRAKLLAGPSFICRNRPYPSSRAKSQRRPGGACGLQSATCVLLSRSTLDSKSEKSSRPRLKSKPLLAMRAWASIDLTGACVYIGSSFRIRLRAYTSGCVFKFASASLGLIVIIVRRLLLVTNLKTSLEFEHM